MILIIISKNLYEVGVQMLCQNIESGNKGPIDNHEGSSVQSPLLFCTYHNITMRIDKPCIGIQWEAARSLKDPHFADPKPYLLNQYIL